jgi:hypothetical protein
MPEQVGDADERCDEAGHLIGAAVPVALGVPRIVGVDFAHDCDGGRTIVMRHVPPVSDDDQIRPATRSHLR